MSSSTFPDKERLLPILWDEFLSKIDLEWKDKYAAFGKNRQQIRQQSKFLAAVATDVSSTQEINAQTLRNYFSKNRFPARIKGDIILAVLSYLGYPNWKAFLDEHSTSQSKLKETEEGNDNGISRDGGNWLFWGPIITACVLQFPL